MTSNERLTTFNIVLHFISASRHASSSHVNCDIVRTLYQSRRRVLGIVRPRPRHVQRFPRRILCSESLRCASSSAALQRRNLHKSMHTLVEARHTQKGSRAQACSSRHYHRTFRTPIWRGSTAFTTSASYVPGPGFTPVADCFVEKRSALLMNTSRSSSVSRFGCSPGHLGTTS